MNLTSLGRRFQEFGLGLRFQDLGLGRGPRPLGLPFGRGPPFRWPVANGCSSVAPALIYGLGLGPRIPLSAWSSDRMR